MTSAEEFLAQVRRQLAAVVDREIGDRTIRYVMVVAAPSEQGGAEALVASAFGNAGRRLTSMLLADALIKSKLMPELRQDRR